jgi:hypothetical protein
MDIRDIERDARRGLGGSIGANLPSILTSAGNVLSTNLLRKSFTIFNCGTNPLFVLLGTGCSSTIFHVILAAGTGANDGTGGYVSSNTYLGIVSVAGTSPSFTVTEET